MPRFPQRQDRDGQEDSGGYPEPEQEPRRSLPGRGGSQFGAFKARLLMALVVAAFALFNYLRKGDINPLTGEMQRVGLSVQDEIAMGLQSAPEMANQHGGRYHGEKECRHVEQLGQRLVSVLTDEVEKAGRSNPFTFDFHLLADEETINAFALPGGQVFVTYALYSKLETEGQLAGVIGHEIGHVVNRHSAQRIAKAEFLQGLAQAGGVAGGDANSAKIASMVANMRQLKHGRDHELESDRWGVRLCTLAGYDPRAMLKVMDILEASSGSGGPPEMMSSHPKPANRKQYIEDVIQEVFPQGMPEGLEP